jgi:hypothetical protein
MGSLGPKVVNVPDTTCNTPPSVNLSKKTITQNVQGYTIYTKIVKISHLFI